MQIFNSHIHDNYAERGGGLTIGGYVVLSQTVVASNTAINQGGGLYIGQGSGTADVEQSTLSGNFAQDGGGIFLDGFVSHGAILTLTNSTLSGNAVSRYGGGLYVYNAQAQLSNATIADNRVQLGFPLPGPGIGGGLYITATAEFTAENSLIANNARGNGITLDVPDDCFSSGTVGTLAYDLILTTTNCFVSGPQGGNIVGQDPFLGPLQNNGGSTQTQALLPGSPAIDTGTNSGCPATDQRGARRTDGFCDIGAYEVVPVADLSVGERDSSDPVLVGAPLTYTVSVTNTGPAPATGVMLTDTLPVGVTLRTATATQGGCLGTVTVTCNLGGLASGAHLTVTMAVTPTVAGVITNTVTAAASEFDPVLANNTASETTAVVGEADLSVRQHDSSDPVPAGTPLTYTVVVTNTGPALASGVTLTDSLPLGAALWTVAASQGSCLGTVTVVCHLGGLASGANMTVTVAVTPTAAGVITNTVAVTANEFDPMLANNTASETTAVIRQLYLPLVRRGP